MLKKFFDWLKISLEKLDHKRDKILFFLIKKYWPRWIKPNYLTYIRIIIGIALFVLLFYFNIDDKPLIVLLFIVGILTDLFDGSVARCLNMESKFGAMIDPGADRIIIIPIAIYSLVNDHRWLLLIIIILEVANGLFSVYGESKSVYLKPNIFAKTKMVMHSVVFAMILITWPKAPNLFFTDILWLAVIAMILSIFIKVLEINSQLNIKNIANKEITIKRRKNENKTRA